MSYTNIEHLEEIRNKKVLFIDIETTGIIKTPFGLSPELEYPDFKTNKYDNARLLSIGYLYMETFDFDYEINLNNIYEKFIKPNNFVIPDESIKIHGLTHDFLNEKGKKIKNILKILKQDIIECDYIVGYNVFFDVNIILSELYRIKFYDTIEKILKLKEDKKILCVGILSSKYSKPDNWTQNKNNKYQIPKQKEVYKKCFNVYPENEHNAKSDILTMIKILFWIYENTTIEKKIEENVINKNNTLTLNILSYNLFYEEDSEQIKQINKNNFDILFLQEASEKINDNLKNYTGNISKSHCCYTYLGLNNNLTIENINVFRKNGVIINHLKINNTELIIGSLHLSTDKKFKETQIKFIERIINEHNLNKIPIILGGDTNMLDKESLLFLDDVYLNQNNDSYYLTYPNRNFKDNRITSPQKYDYRYDRFYIKNCNFKNFETIPNSNSDHLSIKIIITIEQIKS